MDLFEIGELVRRKRKEKGLTQDQLAEAAGISRVRINQFEGGRMFNMQFGTVLSVLNALDLDLRIGDYNAGRPVFEDIVDGNDQDDGPGI